MLMVVTTGEKMSMRTGRDMLWRKPTVAAADRLPCDRATMKGAYVSRRAKEEDGDYCGNTSLIMDSSEI
jgi:hypothetical protein